MQNADTERATDALTHAHTHPRQGDSKQVAVQRGPLRPEAGTAGLTHSHVGAAQAGQVASEETGHPFPLGPEAPSGNGP